MEKEREKFFACLGKMWTGAFDFRGSSSRREYLIPLIFQIFMGMLTFALWYQNETLALFDIGYAAPGDLYFSLSELLPGVFLVYMVLSLEPMIALTARRLRRVGRSAWWLCLLLVVGVGFLVLMFFCVTGDFRDLPFFSPGYNVEVPLYAAPDPDVEDPVFPENPHSFDPRSNVEVDVYGPPDFFE